MRLITLFVWSARFSLRNSWPIFLCPALYLPAQLGLEMLHEWLIQALQLKENFSDWAAIVIGLIIVHSVVDLVYHTALLQLIWTRLSIGENPGRAWALATRTTLPALLAYFLILNFGFAFGPILAMLPVFVMLLATPFMLAAIFFELKGLRQGFLRNLDLVRAAPLEGVAFGAIRFVALAWLPFLLSLSESASGLASLAGYLAVIFLVPVEVAMVTVYFILSRGKVPEAARDEIMLGDDDI